MKFWLTRSKSLWNSGCSEVSNLTFICALLLLRISQCLVLLAKAATSSADISSGIFGSSLSDSLACRVKPSLCSFSMLPFTKSMSFVTSMQFLGRNDVMATDSFPVTLGTMLASSVRSLESWLSTSNVLMLSTSSPKKSRR